MDKLVTFAGYDNRSGPHIFPIEEDRARTIGHIKMARALPPEIERYIKTAKEIKGKTQLLIDAMGAGEYWGSNVNGDYFPEEALRHKGPDYGYETFMHYAYPFKHHVNKDPSRAFGDKVTLSAYDEKMHRILLIVSVDNAKCQDILADLAAGKYWDVSMGCRVPWDECSKCHNRARNRGEYCADLKYQMNKILDNGIRVTAINRLPKLFDISFVLMNAEKASHVLKKVASSCLPYEIISSAAAGELLYPANANIKIAGNKTATMDKQVPSNAPPHITPVSQAQKEQVGEVLDAAGEAKAHEAPLPDHLLNALAEFPLKDVFTTLAALGIDLRPSEFQRIVLVKQGHAGVAAKLASARMVFDESRPGSTVPAWAVPFEHASVEAVNEKVARALAPYLSARSCYPDILAERIGRLEKTADPAMYYNRNSEWFPMTDEQKQRSSGMSGLAPMSLALAAGFMVFKRIFPGLAENGPGPVRALARHPWLLPLLIGAGVGATVGISKMTAPRPMGSGLDGMGGPAYDGSKTASIASPLARLSLIPLAYIYAGVQQRRWERGERLNAVDRFVATRPDLAAIAGVALAPRLGSLAKRASVMGDVAMYAVGTPSKLMPAVITGAVLDSLIFRGLQRLASRSTKGSTYADTP